MRNCTGVPNNPLGECVYVDIPNGRNMCLSTYTVSDIIQILHQKCCWNIIN